LGSSKVIKSALEAALKAVGASDAPQKTAKAYKLFNQKDGNLYPLFVDAKEPVPVGQWLKAKAGELTGGGKVKSKIGELAYRPGWHAGDLPIATHIGAKSHGNKKLPPDTRRSEEVWAEIEMADDVDWQKIANERARITKKGTPDPKTAHITDQVPLGGHYRYKTNPNMTGNWLIGGDMRVNRILDDDEVKMINDAAGVSDLPRRDGYAGGGFITKLLSGVAREAPELSQGAASAVRRATVDAATAPPRGIRALPMDVDNRMYRASEMGFDTQRKRYHLTNKDFDAFKLNADPSSHTGGGAIWLRDDPRYNISAHQVPNFEAEGAREIPLFIKPTKELGTREWSQLRAEGKLNDQFPVVVTPEEGEMLREMGYSHASIGGETVVFDPKNLRSPHAKFNPDDAEDADIMKADGGRVGYAGGGFIGNLLSGVAREAALDSPAFQRWFGASKVADEAGKPKRLYHGTGADIEAFRPSERGFYGKGIYLSDDPARASEYAEYAAENGDTGFGANVMPVYAKFENPFIYEEPSEFNGEAASANLLRILLGQKKGGKLAREVSFGDDAHVGDEIQNALRARGHDGLIVRGAGSDAYGGNEYIAFDPIQLKSAIGNEGTFDPMDARIHKAGGGFITKLLSGVAREAPELSRGASSAARRATVNIGLDINGGQRLTPEQALEALERIGVKPVRSFVAQSDSEPTLVVELSRAMNADEANHISAQLQQEAIAQVDELGAGDLYGPAADKWKPFNGDYFIRGDGKRLTEQIMEAGDPEAVPGGPVLDPVVGKMDEILRGLNMQKPAMAGGGGVRKGVVKAAEWLEQFVKRDNPADRGNVDWLLDKQKYSGPKGLSGADTAWAREVDIPTELLAKMPGARGEVRGPGDPQYDALMKIVQEEGWKPDPISVAINHRGEPFIYEGNTRAAVAKALGIEDIPGDIHWMNGAEKVDNEFSPEKIAAFLEERSKPKSMRLYHGRSYKEPIQRLDPTISPDQLGIHLGDPETASKFATIRPNVGKRDAGARVIPLDVDLQNPLRLMDNHGKWMPSKIHTQLVNKGMARPDYTLNQRLQRMEQGYVQDVDGSWIDDGSEEARLDAMLEVQDMIRALGHDGVVYKNRYEMPEEALTRAQGRARDELKAMSDEDFAKEFPEAVDSYIAFDRKQLKSPFGEGPGVGYAGGGLVDHLDFSSIGRRGYADGGPVWSEEDQASMTHDRSYGTGRDMNYLETMGEKIPLGETNFYDVDGEREFPGGVQGLHDIGRMGVYGVPVVGPWIGAGLDTAEAINNDDAMSAVMAGAFGPGGKMAKAAVAGGLSYAVDPDDAEAGVFGRLGKWAVGSEGSDAFNLAIKLSSKGADNTEIMKSTGWFKDLDGHWKYWRNSVGGSFDPTAKGNKIADVFHDPHLYEEYPHMKNIGYRRKNERGGHWDAGNNEIVMGDVSGPYFQKPEIGGKYGVMHHEGAHAKSSHEGWPNGTNKLGGQYAVSSDIQKMSGQKGDPSVLALAAQLKALEGGEGLTFKRYQAEMGEALARREAAMREVSDRLATAVPPSDQSYLDMPAEALFHPGENLDPEKYRILLKMIEDEAVAADMMSKKTEVYYTNPNPKTGKKK